MRFEQFLIGMLIFGLFVFIGFSLFGSAIVKYDIQDADQDKFSGTHQHMRDIFEQQKDMEQDIRGESVSEDSVEDSMFKGAFKAMKGLWTSTQIMGNITNDIVKESNLADDESSTVITRIASVIMVIVGLLLLSSLVYLVFRFMPR